jgi:alpha-L-fucosidase
MKSKALRLLILAVVLATAAQIATAQLPKETEAQKVQRMKWWAEARFGMFIHWGLYALLARHAWIKNRERMTNE